ncbi:cytidylyltransferase domain-containing protein [Clostridium sp. Cult2]|uniref:cytidylyltransferase domain-containing protein n=1 Tax=Clostridium sp. Cult2 TaxID=2079003 RepID=UPI001F1C33AE|nr:glycosyltransferase family protein [Clostridium sp. Cult2]MCF6465226.1 acylneuraminate cytidylyltransferase [Clostridium sp. Cult2]
MKTVCIIQARMGSTRLPGKVMLDLCGKTVLWHVIERVKRVKNIDEIVIATTTGKKDDVIVEEVLKYGAKVFRGSEEDVLSRYYYAAKENKADVVVRLTSDCPLIDPEVTNDVIDFYLNNNNNLDYVSNTLERTFPRGLDTEVFSFEALEKAFNEATLQRDKEHVTPYIWDNPNKFSLGNYKNNVNYSHLRWTLDTEEDYELISRVYKELFNNEHTFYFREIIELVERKPELHNINATIKQKRL